MSVFRVHAKELGAYERVEGAEHGTKPGGRKMGTRYFTGFGVSGRRVGKRARAVSLPGRWVAKVVR
jgi:hypothetical protein